MARKSRTSSKGSKSRKTSYPRLPTYATPRVAESSFQSVRQILKGFDPVKDKYISREFQKFGYDLAVQLNDLKHKSLYIKLAKETPRAYLEEALRFVKESKPRSKAKLFMWKLKELRKAD